MYTNIRRPSNKAVDLDFEIDSSKGHIYVDYKTPIDFQDLADNKEIDVSNFPSLETVACNMGKKIYHAPDFDVALPYNLDLEYVKSLSIKDRLKYLSDTAIVLQKFVSEYMKKLSQHLLDPTTEIIVGTLGGNGATKGWNEPISGTHALNSGTGNDVFFADDGFKFHTGMNLYDGQLIDLKNNKNIL